jgi:hypothetical protein
MSFKTCFKCKSTLPIESFYKHSKMKDGRLNKCIPCAKKDVIQGRLERIEHYRQYDKARASQPRRVLARKAYRKTPEGKQAVARAHNAYHMRHPERRKAHHAVTNAIRDGKLTKQPCFICGDLAEAHHPDYSRPLAVVWLCNKHHREAHMMVAENMAVYEVSAAA